MARITQQGTYMTRDRVTWILMFCFFLMVMYVEAIGGGWSGHTCSSDDRGLAEGKHACRSPATAVLNLAYFTQSGHKINLLRLAQELWVWSHFHQNNTTQRKFVRRQSVSSDLLQLHIFHEIENHHNFVWFWLICVLLPVFSHLLIGWLVSPVPVYLNPVLLPARLSWLLRCTSFLTLPVCFNFHAWPFWVTFWILPQPCLYCLLDWCYCVLDHVLNRIKEIAFLDIGSFYRYAWVLLSQIITTVGYLHSKYLRL